jgi:hypothetical protein
MGNDVSIRIGAAFVGKKAFKEADSATQKLSSGVKKLANAVGLAYGTTAIIAFGKASIKAAAADQKAQQQLALALKNVGLGRDIATSEDYIQRLQSEFGVIDDLLRPAYQTLAVATRDTAEAQKLLQISLDISASTGKDLGSVTAALSKAYLGNNTALSKLGVGISKADLKTKSFKTITDQLAVTFAGSATAAASSFQGSIDKLGVASANVSEIIGTGLIDALKGLSDDGSVDNLAKQMESTALYLADVIRGIGVLAAQLKNIPGLSSLFSVNPLIKPYLDALRKLGKVAPGSGIDQQGLAHLAELQAKYSTTILSNSKKITAEANKQLQAARLKAAIDKANLALGKGTDVFDIEKIQLQAAEINQAQQLGKVTSQAQLLQITNDLARLETKKAILALEAAIATGDEKAITAATAKLNANLGILGSLTGQQLKLKDIQTILDDIAPKDLINIKNLDEAIAKLKLLGTGVITPVGTPAAPSALAPATVSMPSSLVTGAPISNIPSRDNRPDYGAYGSFAFRAQNATPAAPVVNVTVQAGLGDPNAIAETVTKVIQDAIDRGTVRNLAVL